MPPSKSPSVSLGDVAASILDAPLPSRDAAVPILARRRGPEKRIAEEKAEEREAQAVSRAKRALAGQAHQKLKHAPAATNPVLETNLKKTATQGVVALFNAVRMAQKEQPDSDSSKAKKRKRIDEAGGAASAGTGAQPAANLSKDSFLDILRRGSGGGGAAGGSRQQLARKSAETSEPSSGARFLRDDFMLGRNRHKDWEREDGALPEVDGGEVEMDGHGADFEDE